MSSTRKSLRRTVQELLIDQTSAQGRVYRSAADLIAAAETPSLGVYTINDPAETHEEGPRVYRRPCELLVEGIVARSSGADADDDLDDLAQQVFDIIESNLRSLVSLFDLDHGASGFLGEEMDVRAEGSKPTAASRMRWRLVYFQTRPGLAEGVAPFAGADVEWEVPGTSPAELEAADAIDLPQV